jgi:hypothetical protein
MDDRFIRFTIRPTHLPVLLVKNFKASHILCFTCIADGLTFIALFIAPFCKSDYT